jgi:uncharacterized protein (TIGR02996 family)
MSEKGLTRAILDAPDDDVPRLVYADWLEEHGDDARAEFIRLQCRLARLDSDDPDVEALRGRQRELLSAHQASWKQSLPSRLRGAECTFRRGFVAEVRTTARQFVRGAAALRKSTPLEGADLTYAQEIIPALAACPHLAGLTVLRLRGHYAWDSDSGAGVTPADLRLLAESGLLRAVRELELDRCPLKAAGARVLTSRAFADLRVLRLRGCGLMDAASLKALTGAAFWANVESLDLACNWFREDGGVGLGAWPAVRLRELDLSATGLTDDGMAALGNASFAANLRTLDFGVNSNVGSAGVVALLAPGRYVALRKLDMDCLKCGGEGVEALADAACLKGLETLVITNAELKDDDVEALARARHFKKLRTLNLWANHLGDGAVKALTRSKNFPALRSLTLAHNAITDAGAKMLVESPLAERLVTLGLWQTKLSEAGKRLVRERFAERVNLG